VSVPGERSHDRETADLVEADMAAQIAAYEARANL
jgi:hypothetical protein